VKQIRGPRVWAICKGRLRVARLGGGITTPSAARLANPLPCRANATHAEYSDKAPYAREKFGSRFLRKRRATPSTHQMRLQATSPARCLASRSCSLRELVQTSSVQGTTLPEHAHVRGDRRCASRLRTQHDSAARHHRVGETPSIAVLACVPLGEHQATIRSGRSDAACLDEM